MPSRGRPFRNCWIVHSDLGWSVRDSGGVVRAARSDLAFDITGELFGGTDSQLPIARGTGTTMSRAYSERRATSIVTRRRKLLVGTAPLGRGPRRPRHREGPPERAFSS